MRRRRRRVRVSGWGVPVYGPPASTFADRVTLPDSAAGTGSLPFRPAKIGTAFRKGEGRPVSFESECSSYGVLLGTKGSVTCVVL